MYDAIVISDLHLGSAVCQTHALTTFLDSILMGELVADRLILNGDVFDSFRLARMRPRHWEVLSQLRELSDRLEVIWLCGNHDGPPELASQFLGISVECEYAFWSGGVRVLALHGDRFDSFIDRYPRMTDFADRCYRMLQRIDPSHTLAQFAKHRSKTFLRCTEILAEEAIAYAGTRGFDAVCCGHTHFAIDYEAAGVQYYNSGCWTEKTCHYLTIGRGTVSIHRYHPSQDLPSGITLAEEPGTVLT